MSRISLLVVLTVLFFLPALASAQEEDMSLLKFVVIKDYNGKPVRNASVVLHPVKGNGKQSRGGLQLKSDAEGKASFDGVPYGKLRVQVLSPGFQTFGQDYDIDQPVEEITIRMKRPAQQYSIYEDHPNDKKETPDSQTPPESESKDKPK